MRINRWANRVHPSRPHPLPLLSVCRQIHNEAEILPYALSIFHFGCHCGSWETDLGKIVDFMSQRTPARLSVIKEVSIFTGQNTGNSLQLMFKELDKLPGFQTMWIHYTYRKCGIKVTVQGNGFIISTNTIDDEEYMKYYGKEGRRNLLAWRPTARTTFEEEGDSDEYPDST